MNEQIIIGSLLGDGCITKDKRYEGYTFIESHSIKQKDYLLWKNKYLGFKFTKYKNNVCRIRKSYKKFRYYKNLFYPNNKKIVMREILDMLEPLALAVWYMDDGSYNYKHSNIRLYTQSFGLEGNQIIQEYFKDKWDIKCKIQKKYYKKYNQNHYYLEFNNNSKKFIEIIKPYIIPSMEYKIGLDMKKRDESKRKYKIYNKNYYHKNINKDV